MEKFKKMFGKPKKSNIRDWVVFTWALMFFFLVLLSVSYYNYMGMSKDIISDIDKRLSIGVVSIKSLLPEDFHDRATDIDSISLEEDDQNIKLLSEFANKINFKFLYTLIKIDNKIYITSSSATKEELAENEQVRYFTPFDEADPKFHIAFDSDTPISFTHQDRWGTFRALAITEKSPDGKKYLSVAEFDISYVNNFFGVKLVELLIGAFLLILGTVPLLYTLLKRVQRQSKEQQKMEKQLQQAQKMEAIGTLAGGIAHDFNNILGAIIGYTEMARDDSPNGSSIAEDLDNVLEASDRAVGLVKQILSFSRQDETENVLLQPASIVNKAILMLRPSLPTTIEIIQDIDTKTGLIFADPTQIQQILMNLCTNAFHAMEKTGGRLDISLKEIDPRDGDLSHEPDVVAGTFIQLSVGDSGAGMTQEVKDKIFDPYFTTKGVGKGTGMGLSIAHGIIKSYGGFITLSSEPGKGTVFHVFLPVVNKEELPAKEASEQIPVGIERVLFIDDEDVLADMGKNMLERLGYHVTVRKSSLEALETFQNQPDQFDVVITDQTMPGMTGIDLARRMLQIRSDIPIILCTGYSSTISQEKAKSMGIKEFALKPVGKKDIAMLIRKVLDEN
jgi:signal transduction histidine kinase/ActR/RegA family two-component response regulator